MITALLAAGHSPEEVRHLTGSPMKAITGSWSGLHRHSAVVVSIPKYLDAAEDTLRLTAFEDVRLHWCSACESSHDHVASDEIWDALLSHRVLRRWKWLECSRREVDARRLRALVESPHLCRLETSG